MEAVRPWRPGTRPGRAARSALVASIVVTAWFASAPDEASAHPVVTYGCLYDTVQTECAGWHRRPVSVVWTVTDGVPISGCVSKNYATDTPVATESCLARDPSDGATTEVPPFPIRVDQTPPVVTGGDPARSPDVNGWYNHSISVAFRGSDPTSGVESCTAVSYGGPDSGAATLEGVCVDRAGNVSAPLGYGLKYDETPPVVTAVKSERPPDHAGWFNAPVRFTAEATDATSGVSNCPPVTYNTPDSAAASVDAGCHDRAGNVAMRAFGLRFDTTPPSLTKLESAAGDRRVTLRWSTDAQSVEVVRTPGVGSEPATTVFRGPGSRFVDTKVVNRRRYSYELRVADAAGNVGRREVIAVPRPRLLAPARSAVLKAAGRPLLRWTPVRKARYYNVQVFREGRKVLSAWPTRPRLRLPRRWKHQGRLERLVPGEYKWLVWPGRGARSKGDYGRLIGSSRFTVVR
jgi:hypothetical protein